MASRPRDKRARSTAGVGAGPAAERREDPLGRAAHFRLLPLAERRRLLGRCTERVLAEGEVLFAEGAPCRGLYVLVDGRVELRQVSPRGREQVLHAEGPGATLGEAPLFDREGYVASAVATARTRALFVPRAEVIALFRRHPSVALSLLATLARRVRRFAELAGSLTFRPVVERLAHHLVTAAGGPGSRIPAGHTVDLALTQEQLAAHVGTVRELVARALAQLEQSGVIARDRSRIVIRDPVRLARLARGAGDSVGV